MKIIHCADLHLDSKMNANLDKEKAKKRKSELLNTFSRMVDYAAENDVNVILIVGDMFDTASISVTTKNMVLDLIMKNETISFYYLKGNHDNDNFLTGLDELPHNLKLFSSEWKTYYELEGKVAITGLELNKDNSNVAYLSLVLDQEKTNIVMLHGQESEGNAKDKTEIINLKALRNKGIDYLALGHIHAYKEERLDPRAIYCYPGCLEGRGFDEVGEHGFVLLEVDENTGDIERKFVPFAYRKLHELEVDIEGATTTSKIIEIIDSKINDPKYRTIDLMKIVLKGALDVECEKDINYILSRYEDRFFFVKIYDETSLKVDIEDYRLDESLKGEFVRQVLDDSAIPDDDKMVIIRYGLQAIANEEVN